MPAITKAGAVERLPIGTLPDAPALVERARLGEDWAREALYRQHVHRVTGVVARLLRHGPDVEDVVQDTFIDALQDLPQLRQPEQFGRWVVRIAVHKVHKRFRRRKLRRWVGLERPLEDEPLASQVHEEAPQHVRAELAAVDAALDRVRHGERVCWVLRHLEGYELTEVAELAGCSLATVKRRIARAQSVIDTHFSEARHG
jgi:RNA polymerase sigma-70 factor (ECF subfamily)